MNPRVTRIRVLVAKDRLTAEVQVVPGAAADAEALRSSLAQAQVAHGLDQAVLTELGVRLLDPALQTKRTVARGEPPQAGQDGRVELAFALALQPGHARRDGGIDFRERELLHSVANGDEIARVVAPVPGRSGRDVRGQPLPPPPAKPASLRPGPGARLEPDGRVVAARDGVVVVRPGTIDVVAQWQHDGDVDLHSGNLHSRGSLLVRGNVCEGAAVEADGDVVVQGAIFDARVAAGGNVLVNLGIQGGHSRVEAGGDLHCRHATAALLTAGGTLRVQDQLAHCRARACSIEALHGRGHAFGGELRARDGVRVLHAGTPGGAPTLLAVADLSGEQDELVRKQHAADAARRQALREAEPTRPRLAGRLGRQQAEADDAVLTTELQLTERQREVLQQARIEVLGTLHPGVRIQFGPTELTIQEPLARAAFRWDAETGAIVQEEA
jgi:uncharacterized protein (DUF342 family)